jgi:hypothetical protein
MSKVLTSQGVDLVQIDRPLHEAMVELRRADWSLTALPEATSLSLYPQFELWGLTTTRSHKDPADPHFMRITYAATPFGRALAEKLPHTPPSSAKGQARIPLAEIMALLPPDMLAEFEHPPVPNRGVARFFYDMGVFAADPVGRTDAGGIPLTVIPAGRWRKAAGEMKSDGPVRLSMNFTSEQRALLRRCAIGQGLDYMDRSYDGRHVRVFGDKDGIGIVRVISDGGKHWYRVPPEYRRLALAIADGEDRLPNLFAALPEETRYWFVSEFASADPPLVKLLVLMGLVRRRGKYDWRYTRFGKDSVPLLLGVHRQLAGVDAGELTLDLTVDEPPPESDLFLPDEDDPLDALTVDDVDPWDIL